MGLLKKKRPSSINSPSGTASVVTSVDASSTTSETVDGGRRRRFGFRRKPKAKKSPGGSSSSASVGATRLPSSDKTQLFPPTFIDGGSGSKKGESGSSGVLFSCYSLATGSFGLNGLVSLVPSPRHPLKRNSSNYSNATSDESVDDGTVNGDDDLSTIKEAVRGAVETLRSTMFLRTADLPSFSDSMSRSTHDRKAHPEDELDHVDRPSSHPPLEGMEHDLNENWVALDDGRGQRAPLVQAAVDALVRTCVDAAMDRNMWTSANSATTKAVNAHWKETVFCPLLAEGESQVGPVLCPDGATRGSKIEKDVLLWSGTFSHKYYGADLAAIRSESVVNMSPTALANLLVDSTRVKEYNKMSMGRDDILVLHDDTEGECVTKVIKSRSKPPLLGKIIQLKSLLHMERLRNYEGGKAEGESSDGDYHPGYVIVTRAIAHADDPSIPDDPKVIHSEMLMGVNVIRSIEGDNDRCVMINVNHLRSPMIPAMMGKRIGLGAAGNFVNDIRALC